MIITRLITEEQIEIDTTTFVDDMVILKMQDGILTLLIHLRYLLYNNETGRVFILNYEIRQQFVSTVKVLKWTYGIDAVRQSDTLLRHTLEQNAEKCLKF